MIKYLKKRTHTLDKKIRVDKNYTKFYNFKTVYRLITMVIIVKL